jgi:hypothetical protein
MTLLNIPFVPQNKHAIEKTALNNITHEPWGTVNQLSCSAAFAISHFDTGIHIRFSVTEPFLRARKRKINGEVHKDNCVEFFIAFGGDGSYYNFEFNCLGSVKAAYGKSRLHRKFIPADILKNVVDSSIIHINNRQAAGAVKWDIAVVLPLSVFCYSNKSSLSGQECAVNFAKCGDSLPKPHFLSWVQLHSEKPDFHQPASFGKVKFAPIPDNL